MIRRTAKQQGFTIIEVMIAALVILLALGVVVTTAVGMRHLATTSETKTIATKIAQQELERLRTLDWSQLEMDGTPTQAAGSDPASPLSGAYLSGTNYRPSANDQPQPLDIGTPVTADPTDPASLLANCTTGAEDQRCVSVPSPPTSWTNGTTGHEKVSGNLYRFVTYGDDPNTPSTTQDYKRITVAVTVTAPAGAIQKPVILSTEIANPSDTVVHTTTGSGTPPATKNYLTYYAYDTSDLFTSRQDQTGDHPRDKSSTKPDLMDVDPPPDPNCSDTYPNCDPPSPVTVPTYNYTTDTTATLAMGAGLKKSPGCVTGGDDKVHFWVSNALATGTTINLTGNATADLYTQTMAGNALPGSMCISVYDVVLKADGTGTVQTKTLVGTTQRMEMNPATSNWYTAYNELQFDFRFLDPTATYYPVTAGHRIGVLISASDHLLAPNSATAATDLAVMYDHPDYPTSFGFETQ